MFVSKAQESPVWGSCDKGDPIFRCYVVFFWGGNPSRWVLILMTAC